MCTRSNADDAAYLAVATDILKDMLVLLDSEPDAASVARAGTFHPSLFFSYRACICKSAEPHHFVKYTKRELCVLHATWNLSEHLYACRASVADAALSRMFPAAEAKVNKEAVHEKFQAPRNEYRGEYRGDQGMRAQRGRFEDRENYKPGASFIS